MKQSIGHKILSKKWIITTSLLAVLVSQYFYQTSSITLSKADAGEYVMASTSDTKTTEAGAPECTGDCTKPVFNAEEFAKLYNLVLDLKKAQKPSTTVAEATPAPSPSPSLAPASASVTTTTPEPTAIEEECGVATTGETRTEVRARLACVKKEKENAKLEILNEKFDDKIEELKEKCARFDESLNEKLECLTSGFTTVLSRFDGSKSIPLNKVRSAFNTLVRPTLNKALYSDDSEVLTTALSSIQTLMQDMPEKYRFVKESVIETVKAKAQLAAQKVTASYTELKTMVDQKTPGAPQAYAKVQAEHQSLMYLTQSYSSSITESLQTVNDETTFAYYRRSYVPDMQKILGSVSNTTEAVVLPTVPPTTPATTTTAPATTPSRPERTDETSGTTQTNDDAKMTRDGLWTSPKPTSNFRSAPPTGQPQKSGRGGREL